MTNRAALGSLVLLAIVLLATNVLLSGCDIASAGNTAILNAASTVPPTTRYEFTYGPPDVTTEGRVAVVSDQEDNLGNVLSQNGFSRSDIVSARVDSVVIERLSAPTFGYLTGADVHLGSSASAPRIATGDFSPSAEAAQLDVVTSSVTGIVSDGSTEGFALLSTDDPDNIPEGDRVRVTVYFQLEVEGV